MYSTCGHEVWPTPALKKEKHKNDREIKAVIRPHTHNSRTYSLNWMHVNKTQMFIMNNDFIMKDSRVNTTVEIIHLYSSTQKSHLSVQWKK